MRAAALGLGAMMLSGPATAWAEPTPAQRIYWWQDEIRAAAFDLSIARTGQVAEWPRMTVAAGAMTLPLPPAAGPIAADGRLDEPAWQQATRFPVGPVFDDWQRGPMMLDVSVCRDEKNLYLAIESPRDLAGLGSLGPDGELFRVGETSYPAPAQGGRVVELALPLTGEVTLRFPVEMLRHVDGKLPPEANCLGLQELATPGNQPFRSPTLWLEPITVRLTPANTPVRLSEESLKPSRTNEASGVLPYTWQATLDGKPFAAEGFFYREPIEATVEAARQMLRRSAALRSTKLAEAPSSQQLAAVLDEAKQIAPDDHDAQRALYCRARELRARAHLSMLDAPLLFVKQHPYFAGAHLRRLSIPGIRAAASTCSSGRTDPARPGGRPRGDRPDDQRDARRGRLPRPGHVLGRRADRLRPQADGRRR